MFERTVPAIVKKQSAAPAIDPENSEEKSDIADPGGNESLLRRGGGAWFMNPKSNQEVGGEPNQFPADEEQKETVRDDHAQHGGGEK